MASLDSRSGELAVLAGLAVFFTLVGVALLLTGHADAAGGAVIVGAGPQLAMALVAFVRGDRASGNTSPNGQSPQPARPAEKSE